MFKKVGGYTSLLVFVLGWSACAPDPSCSENWLPYLTASFYAVDEEGNEAVETVYLDSVWADGASLLYKNDTTNIYGLFMDPDAESTTYHFCLNDTCESITFSYDRREYLISPECGPGFRFQNLKAIYEGTYDSVIINKTELTLLGEVNVKIYR